jgi:ABC-type multidrug transport system fused ATPase/permease subunit
MRLYDPEKGSITIDGTNLKDINLPWFHHNVTAIVSQEPEMFEGSVQFNIGYCTQETKSLEEISDSAKLADADKFIRDKDRFPDGYETLVGEKGVKLSGG